MSKGPKDAQNRRSRAHNVPEPVDVVEGIPDRSARPAVWQYVAIAAVFALWIAMLVYCAVAP